MYSQTAIAVALNKRSPLERTTIVRRVCRGHGVARLAQPQMRKAETLFLPIQMQHFVIVSDCFIPPCDPGASRDGPCPLNAEMMLKQRYCS